MMLAGWIPAASRRSLFLRLFGIVHVLIGSSFLFPETSAAVETSLGFLGLVDFPVWVAGALWVLSGVVVIGSSFIQDPARNAFGFQTLVSVEVAWAMIYVLSWVGADATRGWVSASIYLGLAGAVFTVSGMVSASEVLAYTLRPNDEEEPL